MELIKVFSLACPYEPVNIWFKVDGKIIFKAKDEAHYKGGKVILRIRGTGHELACIMKNIKIYSKD